MRNKYQKNIHNLTAFLHNKINPDRKIHSRLNSIKKLFVQINIREQKKNTQYPTSDTFRI